MAENGDESQALESQQVWDEYEDACKKLDRRVAAQCNWRFVLTRFNANTRLNFTEGELRGALRLGELPPSLLFAICRSADLSVWDEAQRLGLLPDNLEDWLNARNHISSAAAVAVYLRSKRRNSGHLPDKILKGVQEAIQPLNPNMRASIQFMDRGIEERQPYHSYLILSDEGEPSRRATLDPERIRATVEKTLRNMSVNAHWEHSSECKPVGHEHDEALIVETFFDNKPARDEPSTKGPLAVLGVYYSGAKDIAVLVSRETGLGALDCSRYIAETVRDSDRFRRDNGLMAATFWNAIQGDQASKLCVTIDDVKALTDSPVHQSSRARVRAKVFLLTLNAEALMYAAFRVAYGERSNECERVTREKVQAKYRELTQLQKRLGALAYSAFSDVQPVAIDIDVPARSDGTYPDAVDALFDVYATTAQRIVGMLT